jgi:hypothetical protein
MCFRTVQSVPCLYHHLPNHIVVCGLSHLVQHAYTRMSCASFPLVITLKCSLWLYWILPCIAAMCAACEGWYVRSLCSAPDAWCLTLCALYALQTFNADTSVGALYFAFRHLFSCRIPTVSKWGCIMIRVPWEAALVCNRSWCCSINVKSHLDFSWHFSSSTFYIALAKLLPGNLVRIVSETILCR